MQQVFTLNGLHILNFHQDRKINNMKNNEINLLFGATSDYLPFALVTAMSVIDNVSKDTMVNIHFLYADIVKPISSEERNNWFEMAQ